MLVVEIEYVDGIELSAERVQRQQRVERVLVSREPARAEALTEKSGDIVEAKHNRIEIGAKFGAVAINGDALQERSERLCLFVAMDQKVEHVVEGMHHHE